MFVPQYYDVRLPLSEADLWLLAWTVVGSTFLLWIAVGCSGAVVLGYAAEWGRGAECLGRLRSMWLKWWIG